MKILVAEDDVVSLTAVTRVLRRAGHEIITAQEGLAAWECLQGPDAPQVAVLDWMMPGLDGPEICRRMRAQTPRQPAYLLLLTGRTDPKDLILGLEAGANDFLHKPFDPAELKARLEVGRRTIQLYNDLAQNVRDLATALAERKAIEDRLRQRENHLRMVMNTVPVGVLVCNALTGEITESNPVAQQCLGLPAAELAGNTFHRFFQSVQGQPLEKLPEGPAGGDCRLVSAGGQQSEIRLTQAEVRFDDQDLRLLSFLDISDTRRLLAEQRLSIDQARKLLTIVNAGLPRWIGINDELTMHVASFSASSQRAGGDHFWVRTMPEAGGRGPATLLGLRDQSGHEVSCILRSIATDLFQNEAIKRGLDLEEQMAWINDRICASGLFAEDEFLTGTTLEFDHTTLRLRYLSCGHPPVLLLRQTDVMGLPPEGGPGQNFPLGSLPGAKFVSGQCQLLPGDRLLLFTDGLLELGTPAGRPVLSVPELFALVADLLKIEPDIPVQKLMRKLLRAAAGDPDSPPPTAPPDDVTIMGVELEPDAGPQEMVFHPSGREELDGVVQLAYDRLVSDWGLQPESTARLRLVLDEALTNAWLHGNQQDHRLPVRVRWGARNGHSIVVEDAGRGFDLASLPDPRTPAAQLLESGRGVYLIRNSCEWVQWKKQGARLVARLAVPAS